MSSMEGFFDVPGFDHESVGAGEWKRTGSGASSRVWVPAVDPRPHVADVTFRIVSALAAEQEQERSRRFVGRLCECGCAMAADERFCPACRVWAERDAARASWSGPVMDEVWAS